MNVHLLGFPAAGLNEELMALLVGKADELRFDRRAVARTCSDDVAGIHSRARYIVKDYFVCIGVCVNYMAGNGRCAFKLALLGL